MCDVKVVVWLNNDWMMNESMEKEWTQKFR